MAEGYDGSEFAFAAEVLAIDGEGLGKQVAVGDEPAVERTGQRSGVDGVEQVVEGIVAGHEEQAAFRMAAGQANRGALLLGERAAFLPDAFDVGRAAKQAIADEGEHGADGMAAGFGVARVIDLAQGVTQAAQGLDGQGAAGSASGFGDAGTVRFGELAGDRKQRAGVLLKGPDPELLGASEVLIKVGAVAAEAFGEAQRGPVGDFVKGALVVGGIMEALGEQRGEAVETLPFGGQFAQSPAEALAGEVGAAMGLDDHEAAQLHDELEAVGAGDGVPADPFVPVLEAFGRASPAEDGDEPVGSAFRVALPSTLPKHVPGGASGSKIMLLVEQGAQLADFERFGGGSDDRRECRIRCRTRQVGAHGAPTMVNRVGLSSRNCRMPNLQAPFVSGPIALRRIRAGKRGVTALFPVSFY